MPTTETNRIENKEQLNDDFEQEVIAFLNYREGGVIYVGIRKNGQVVGVNDIDQTQLQIKDRIKNNIQPSTLGLFDVIVETREDKEVIKIVISNGTSIYAGTNKVDLLENYEFGYCSLIKATQSVIDKMTVENKRSAKITSKTRIEKTLVDSKALKEAIINAMVHNDYSSGIPPVFEIFSDRFTITSYGGLPQEITQEDFFNAVSAPRNKELMRVFKDVDLVEQLGSGMERIMSVYDKSIFEFLPNFLRINFYFDEEVLEYLGQTEQDKPNKITEQERK